MRTIEVATIIAAPPLEVWAVLTDFPRYPAWSAYIQELSGRAEEGARLRLVQGPPGQRPHVVDVPVIEATPGVRLAWRAVIPGAPWLPRAIFTGTHEFVLTALADGGTELTHREYFSGLLARMVKEGAPGGDQGFEAFNTALKHRVEESAAVDDEAGHPA
ncbi:SRPBCC family protein [Actinoallomurus sp. CA-150999]|uniref:SRPBCC family protein n=1 Tax=Actinoallomurus sp. CA-150999 TaxID=3239887 RepID=UPI003D8C554A